MSCESPHLVIVEQPARSGVRFRYECETRGTAVIRGDKTSDNHLTYPSVRICDYSGSRAMIVVSCVTTEEPYRQHPHHLVGGIGCHNGVYSKIIPNFSHIFELKNIGIQCSKKTQIKYRLRLRKLLGVDPTNRGFGHMSAKKVNLKSFRLCFQAYIEDPVTGVPTVALQPVVSDPIYDKKVLPTLAITDMSTTCCPMSGTKVMLFCNRIDDNDIEVVFYQTNSSGHIVWHFVMNVTTNDLKIHKKVGISLIAPPYPYNDYTCGEKYELFIQLRRPSDNNRSKPIVLTYLPDCYSNCPLSEDVINNCESLNEHDTILPTNKHDQGCLTKLEFVNWVKIASLL